MKKIRIYINIFTIIYSFINKKFVKIIYKIFKINYQHLTKFKLI